MMSAKNSWIFKQPLPPYPHHLSIPKSPAFPSFSLSYPLPKSTTVRIEPSDCELGNQIRVKLSTHPYPYPPSTLSPRFFSLKIVFNNQNKKRKVWTSITPFSISENSDNFADA